MDENQRHLEQTALRSVRAKLDAIDAEEDEVRHFNSGMWKVVVALLIVMLLLVGGLIFSKKDATGPIGNWPVLKQPETEVRR